MWGKHFLWLKRVYFKDDQTSPSGNPDQCGTPQHGVNPGVPISGFPLVCIPFHLVVSRFTARFAIRNSDTNRVFN